MFSDAEEGVKLKKKKFGEGKWIDQGHGAKSCYIYTVTANSYKSINAASTGLDTVCPLHLPESLNKSADFLENLSNSTNHNNNPSL